MLTRDDLQKMIIGGCLFASIFVVVLIAVYLRTSAGS